MLTMTEIHSAKYFSLLAKECRKYHRCMQIQVSVMALEGNAMLRDPRVKVMAINSFTAYGPV